MKKTSVRKKRESPQDTLRSEYRFDYGKSKPNRFAAKMSQGTVARIGTRGDHALIRQREYGCDRRNGAAGGSW